MGRKGQRTSQSEFPILDGLNLYASSTTGDGNCLFRALSDQVHGDETKHHEIRQAVVKYVQNHADHFSAFVGEYGETFDQYISRLSQDGVYGGHIEIVGFAAVYDKVVVIYQSDNLYLIHPGAQTQTTGSVHIAYHSWEHYSSVRKTGGPRTGPVHLDIPSSGGSVDVAVTSSSDEVPEWKIDIVLKSVPDAKKEQVIEMLRKKDYDLVIEDLLMAEFNDSDTKDSEGVAEEAEKVESRLEPEPVSAPSPLPVEHSGPVSMKEKKLAAKQKRNEKKERVRTKKQKPRADVSLPETDTSKDAETTKMDIKIVNI